MARIEQKLLIRNPIHEVFSLISDGDNAPRWHTSVKEARHLTKPPIQIGSRLLVKAEVGRRKFGWVQEVIAWEPPLNFRDRMVGGLPATEDGPMGKPPFKSFEDGGSFREVPEGTEVTFWVDYRLPWGPLGMLVDVIYLRGRVLKELSHSLERAAEILRSER